MALSQLPRGQSAERRERIWLVDGQRPIVGGDFPSKKKFGNLRVEKEVTTPKLPTGWAPLDVVIPQSRVLCFQPEKSTFLSPSECAPSLPHSLIPQHYPPRRVHSAHNESLSLPRGHHVLTSRPNIFNRNNNKR